MGKQHNNQKQQNNKNKQVNKSHQEHINQKSKQIKNQDNKKKLKHNNFGQKQKQPVQVEKNENRKEQQIDERFAKASYDPKFLRPKQEITKVKVDDRFSKMLTDPAFQNTSKVDKYGRKIDTQSKKKQQNEELKQYYMKDKEEQQEIEDFDEMEEQGNQQEEEQMQEEQDDEQQQDGGVDSIRKWMENYDEESSSLADMPVEQLIQQEENEMPEVWSDDDQNVIKSQNIQATKRLALCNYDWMNINAKDLMILFNSFKPATGFLKSVKVYQSNYGKEKMQEQEMFGPQGIWNDNEEQQFQQEEKKKKRNSRKSWKQLLRKDDSSALNSSRLRAYEKERLKYFYAVIECDNKKTADQIYKQCDGNQFEHSNIQFDLRFVPDDLVFDKAMLKEQCNEMPVTGEVKNFVNRAMGHSKVELTWQDPELSLPASLKKKNWGKMSEEELNKIDWATYLNQEDVEQEQNKKELFLEKDEHEILPDWKKQCNKKYKRQHEGGQKLVISFDSGFGPKTDKKPKQQTQVPSLKKQKKSKKQLRLRAEQQRQKRRQQLALMTQNQQQQLQKSFKPNLEDSRFKAVYENPLFSIDPSNPKFDHRKAGNVFKEVVRRNKDKHSN